MKCLGLNKSELSPSQRTTFLGLVWDSTTMQAHLSPACVDSILNTVTKQILLDLMVPAANGIPLGLLHIKLIQFWLKSRGFSSSASSFQVYKDHALWAMCSSALVPEQGHVLPSQVSHDSYGLR